MTVSDDDDRRWLVCLDAAPYLAEIDAGPIDELKLTARLRKRLTPERARLVVEQAVLRRRAHGKFTLGDRLFFTPLGLEQATDEVTAGYKASRFRSGVTIVDFCCGIGGDLLALGRRGRAVGIDRSPAAVLFAEANCRVFREAAGDVFRGEARVAEASPQLAAECDAWHIDPDRRPAGRRTTDVARHEPDAATIDRLLAIQENAAIKLAPAAEPPAAWRERAECEWISLGGECKQLVVWFGGHALRPGERRATALAADGSAHSIAGAPHVQPPDVAGLGKYLFEPDAAVLAADLVGALSQQYQIAAVHPGSVYLTGDEPHGNALLTAYEIVASTPFDLRRLRALLAERNIGRLEIKKRGVDVDVARLRRELQLRGEGELCLILVRRGDSVTAVLARRISVFTSF